MFDKKAQAQALILDDEGSGHVVDTDLHGVDWEHRKYIVEVRPAGQQPFRVETKAKVPIFHAPQVRDLVTVLYDPKNHKTEIQIEGDERYDPKLIRAKRKQEREAGAARAQALLDGAPVPAEARVVHHSGSVRHAGGPPWKVPSTCSECGARVDQSVASMAEHPKCQYCAQPLPCQPGR